MVETTNMEKCQEACNQRDGCRSFARCVLVITIAWLWEQLRGEKTWNDWRFWMVLTYFNKFNTIESNQLVGVTDLTIFDCPTYLFSAEFQVHDGANASWRISTLVFGEEIPPLGESFSFIFCMKWLLSPRFDDWQWVRFDNKLKEHEFQMSCRGVSRVLNPAEPTEIASWLCELLPFRSAWAQFAASNWGKTFYQISCSLTTTTTTTTRAPGSGNVVKVVSYNLYWWNAFGQLLDGFV